MGTYGSLRAQLQDHADQTRGLIAQHAQQQHNFLHSLNPLIWLAGPI